VLRCSESMTSRLVKMVGSRRCVTGSTKVRNLTTLREEREGIPFYGLPRATRNSTGYPSIGIGNQSLPGESFSKVVGSVKRIGLAAQSAVTALHDPTRADAVAALGELTGTISLQKMYDKMMMDESGQIILLEKPMVTKRTIFGESEDLTAFSQECGAGSFGEAYADFMLKHGFDSDERSKIKHMDTICQEDLSYIMLRYRQCHDFWHTLFDLPPTVLGEISLKWIELIQTGLPVAGLSACFGPLQLSAEERKALVNVYIPWALKSAQDAPFLLNIYYEKLFRRSISELRNELNINVAPDINY